MNSLRESIIRRTGKRDRYEIMCRLALDGILREQGVNVALHPGGWAASASLLMVLARIVTELPINKILELGCGQSTIMLTEFARILDLQLTTIEHDADWAELIMKRSGHEVTLAALNGDGTGYVLNQLPGPFDLIVVDGPPGTGDAHSRSGAFDVIRRHLASPGVVVIDDTHRLGESALAGLVQQYNLGTTKEIRSTSWQTVVATGPEYGAMARSLG